MAFWESEQNQALRVNTLENWSPGFRPFAPAQVHKPAHWLQARHFPTQKGKTPPKRGVELKRYRDFLKSVSCCRQQFAAFPGENGKAAKVR
jgi:hypothetical protein